MADTSRKADTRAMQAKVPLVALQRLVERATTTHRLGLTLGDKELLVINKDMAGKTHMLRECPVALRFVRPPADEYSRICIVTTPLCNNNSSKLIWLLRNQQHENATDQLTCTDVF